MIALWIQGLAIGKEGRGILALELSGIFLSVLARAFFPWVCNNGGL